MNEKGFILVESLIIFLVISSLIVVNLYIINNMNSKDIYLKEKELLITKLTSAKQLAIHNRENVYLDFNNNSIIIQKTNYFDKYTFKTIKFLNTKQLYFNAKGIINHGYTIQFKYGFKQFKLIFYIGKGWFKIE